MDKSHMTTNPKLQPGEKVPLTDTSGKSLVLADDYEGEFHFSIDGTKVRVTYKHGGTDYPSKTHDLATGPLTIGRGSGNGFILAPGHISGKHAQLELDSGKPVYHNLNPTNPPFHLLARQSEATPPAEKTDTVIIPVTAPRQTFVAREPTCGPMPPEGGQGGGYTHENTTKRSENEDSGLAHRGPALEGKAAEDYLLTLIADEIVPAASNLEFGGSTLSVAMRTADRKIACAFLGDSPIYIVARHEQTGDVKLIQVGVPHNGLGIELKRKAEAKSNMPFAPTFDAMLDAADDSELRKAAAAGKLEKKHAIIYRLLGPAGKSDRDYMHCVPDGHTIDPQALCPQGYTYKGMMVCSDGIEAGVKCGEVQKALGGCLRGDTLISPQLLAEAAVHAARRHTSDNITAMFMAAEGPAGDLIAVADGNNGTKAVAETAIATLRAACLRPTISIPDAPNVKTGRGPESPDFGRGS